MIKGLQHLSYKERLWEQGLFHHEQRQLKGGLSSVGQYLKGGCRQDEARTGCGHAQVLGMAQY